mmetsp:Transcript_13181/g.21995  ORF Transcript_13181/g.21995 Transcript_13181/m.21995 type:complete len:84 (+) Transcript_13181:749-1000(+)
MVTLKKAAETTKRVPLIGAAAKSVIFIYTLHKATLSAYAHTVKYNEIAKRTQAPHPSTHTQTHRGHTCHTTLHNALLHNLNPL